MKKRENCKYLGILDANTIKQADEEKIRENHLRRTRKLLEASRNFIKGINARAVSLKRYMGPFLKWTKEELKNKKFDVLTQGFTLRDGIDRLYMSEKMKKEDSPTLKIA